MLTFRPLASKASRYFEPDIRARGHNIFLSKKVRILENRADVVFAHVQGTHLYEVQLTYDQHLLFGSCTCPYFSDRGLCKHLWATVLAADNSGGLEAARSGPVRDVRLDSEYHGADEFDEEESREYFDEPTALRPSSGTQQLPAWREQLGAISRLSQQSLQRRGLPAGEFEILYVLDGLTSARTTHPVIELFQRTRKKDGQWSAPKECSLSADQAASIPNPVDREALAIFLGSQDVYSSYDNSYVNRFNRQRRLPPALAGKLLPLIAGSGRLLIRSETGARFALLLWDSGDPWQFELELKQDDRDQWHLSGVLRRGEDRLLLQEASVLMQSWLIARGQIARLDSAGKWPWIQQLREIREITIPDRQRDDAFQELLQSDSLPPVQAEGPLRFEQRSATPKVGFRVQQKKEHWGEEYFLGKLLFDYGQGWKEQQAAGRGTWLPDERVLLLRDLPAEAAAVERVRATGARLIEEALPAWRVAVKSLPKVVRELIHEGWHVEAEGRAFRRPGTGKLSVSSGVDWFDLHGEIDFGGISATLPELLAALRRGDAMVRLGDGSFGLLPEEWLARLGTIAGMGTVEEGRLRFKRGQAGLLNALLAAQPEATCDEAFSRLRERISTFQGIRAAEQPEGFNGTLRGYQLEGVAWMDFLREFGFGGCLADDMGVGKTAQVLATLELRRAAGAGPSLVVVPKSLIFNWKDEAARFTPSLRILDHTGLERDATLIHSHDVVLTTYGTLRRDVVTFKDLQFDYVVLDEAQAIKNASTDSAKAVRLLRGNYRLALSGTPVENHLGELWSLFEFLNPGMLGEAKALKLTGGLARNPSEETRAILASALRPFILRRTKKQVAAELPDKTEQTVYCEMDDKQRSLYEELRQHYRASLLQRIERNGLAKSKVHVLEALLRLRQAACHPALLDERKRKVPSAKVAELFERINEIREEGHKALVFSQFTSLLSLVREDLDARGVTYEYLDGATRNRKERVDRFQSDPDCGLFLISLKAGGLGLNLTAAEYVFLLDPWWNPAVEAQAIDRAHRIGQTRSVFAYRLITKGTVEEKVLELQKSKKALADSIIGDDNSLLRDLKPEDLDLLLS